MQVLARSQLSFSPLLSRYPAFRLSNQIQPLLCIRTPSVRALHTRTVSVTEIPVTILHIHNSRNSTPNLVPLHRRNWHSYSGCFSDHHHHKHHHSKKYRRRDSLLRNIIMFAIGLFLATQFSGMEGNSTFMIFMLLLAVLMMTPLLTYALKIALWIWIISLAIGSPNNEIWMATMTYMLASIKYIEDAFTRLNDSPTDQSSVRIVRDYDEESIKENHTEITNEDSDEDNQ